MDFAKLRNIVVGLAIGVVAGIGSYTFIYARGYSYMTDDPQACINCHVMREQYDGWINSSHRSVATCNDCHTPAGAVGKYVTKARNGFWHSFYFTTGRFPEPIRITGHNREVAEQSCRKCHSELAESIEGPHQQAGASSCLRCHDTVGHRTRK